MIGGKYEGAGYGGLAVGGGSGPAGQQHSGGTILDGGLE